MKKFNGWNEVSLHDMLLAYRKAKADCFFENTFPASSKFALYERDLIGNLKRLLGLLQGDSEISSIAGIAGEYRLVPKKLGLKRKVGAGSDGHVHFSDSRRNFENIRKAHDVVPEFRVIGDFPVDAHIISALWVNFIGHKFDANLDASCYGARLRRVRPDQAGACAIGEFHGRAIGSFPPYFKAYQRWRSDGLGAIRRELECDKHVIAVSLDLKSYYHTVDPSAISLSGLIKDMGVELDELETDFNASFSRFLNGWSEGAKKYCRSLALNADRSCGGLVIGLTASRVVSNVLLAKWDRLIKERLAPIHYGRYVDDMFIVVRDNGLISSSQEFMKYLAAAIGNDVLYRKNDDNVWSISLGADVAGESSIILQADKQKLFILQGGAGIDLLDSIESEINELSSEHRLMPSPDELEQSPAARVLSAAGVVGDSADTLRRADGLTIRRLSWALQLRHVETLARDLPPSEWIDQRNQFYDFADSHILRPDTLFAHITYIPRLLGFAISMNEWQRARRIATRAYDCLDELEEAVPCGSCVGLNGVSVEASAILWRAVRSSLTLQFADAMIRFINAQELGSKKSFRERPLLELIALELSTLDCSFVISDGEDLQIGHGFRDMAKLVASCDLAKVPYKKMISEKSSAKLVSRADDDVEYGVIAEMLKSSYFDVEVLAEFLSSNLVQKRARSVFGDGESESLLPYLFPTRPLTPAEITELAPECVDASFSGDEAHGPSQIWAKFTRALRGVWVQPTLLAKNMDSDVGASEIRKSRFVKVGTAKKNRIVVALPSIETLDSDWGAMACGQKNLSKDRYTAISEVVNKTIRLKRRPDYLIFPELSLPIEWVDSVSSRLGAAGISLIAGTEYRHVSKSIVHSEACLVLSDNRLGFPSFSRIWQPKLEPAVNEDKDLFAVHGKKWKSFKSIPDIRRRKVYIHNGVNFGVMVCSELQNSRARVSFQGAVDALFVLCWNPDLDTFSSLIESTALDVHAYTVLVNNRKYGDSRIRVPAKKSFDRDLARVRGGDNDFLVAATLDVDALRYFHSRSKRWTSSGDKYKPVPEGFRLHRSRKKLPASGA